MNVALLMFIISAIIILYLFIYYRNNGKSVYKYIVTQTSNIYEKYAPYSFKSVRQKAKELGQEYTPKQYAIQVAAFSIGAFIITYMYFYSIVLSLVYAAIAVAIIPYLTYLRCKRIYSEFVFEQVQVYTTNVIMEFATTQSFVTAMEGVYNSGVLEDPMKADVKQAIEMAYANGTIEQSVEYLNSHYDYYIVRNMHQLFIQITNEGSKNSSEALNNMSLDIDMLVENVYRDRMDRANFHKKFIQFGLILYLMIMLIQFLLGVDTYIAMLGNWIVQLLLHTVLIVNTGFLLSGEKYYNENVGAE